MLFSYHGNTVELFSCPATGPHSNRLIYFHLYLPKGIKICNMKKIRAWLCNIQYVHAVIISRWLFISNFFFSNLINTDIISFSLANGETENLEPPLKLEFLLHKVKLGIVLMSKYKNHRLLSKKLIMFLHVSQRISSYYSVLF